MQPPSDLVAVFRAHAKSGIALPEADELERLLRSAHETASASWPGVVLHPEEYARYLAEKLSEGQRGVPLSQLLERIHHGELYLACACAKGVPEALVIFEREYMAKLPGLLATLPRDDVQDACQKLSQSLLVRPPGGSPGIGAYTGRGTLMNWLRVAVVRSASRPSGPKNMVPIDSVPELIEPLLAAGVTPEMELIKRDWREAFEPCLRDALAALADDEKTLLRFHLYEGLSTVAMARIYGVSQPTISRRIQGVRQKVREATRQRLKERLEISSHDLDSHLAAMDSQIDISISKLFGDEDSGDQGT